MIGNILAKVKCEFKIIRVAITNRDNIISSRHRRDDIRWDRYNNSPFVDADKLLFELFKDSTREGIAIAAPGFYAPQGRWVRLAPHDKDLNAKIESFRFGERRITNFEMEGSALAGLAALMGHRAATICTIIAQRVAKNACTDYKPFVRRMIEMSLDKLATL